MPPVLPLLAKPLEYTRRHRPANWSTFAEPLLPAKQKAMTSDIGLATSYTAHALVQGAGANESYCIWNA